MKKNIVLVIINTVAFVTLIYLAFEMISRFVSGDGDPIMPLTALLLILIGSAIFQQCIEMKEDIAEVKRAAMVFVVQAREETEYLKALNDYNEIMAKINKADLN